MKSLLRETVQLISGDAQGLQVGADPVEDFDRQLGQLVVAQEQELELLQVGQRRTEAGQAVAVEVDLEKHQLF